jgi:hypothetical protein
MGQLKPIDAAWELDRKAKLEGWPFHCDAKLEFERPELNALRDLWHSFAVGKPVPARADFDARTLKPYLKNILIIERVFTGPERWRYRTRLSGTAVTDILGDFTGKFIEEQVPPELVPRWTATYDATLDGGRPLRLVADFELPQLAFLRGEALIAPLTDRDGKPTLVLSCAYFKPKPANRRR